MMHGASVQGAPRRIGTARRLYDWRGGLKELREFRRAGLPHPRVRQAEGKALAVALATASIQQLMPGKRSLSKR